jgi:CheY-like chemotaxis protein
MNSILIIEDDGDIREALLEILTSEGYEVHTATHGQEGLDYLKTAPKPPGLIVLDLMMPVMDGWHFRNQQLQNAALARIPVIVITAEGNATQKAKAMNASAGISKPIDLDEFLKTIKTWITA